MEWMRASLNNERNSDVATLSKVGVMFNMPRPFGFLCLGVPLLICSVSAGLRAEPVTMARVEALPQAEQAAWRSYLERSEALARADAEALRAEVMAAGASQALRAPDGGNFKLPAEADDAWYGGPEAATLADAILSYQTPSGGWSKHTGYGRGPRRPGMQWTSQNEPGESPHYLATFDNRATTEELNFLAELARVTGREDCQAAVLRGLDFIFAAQYPNGGWPQVYPLEGEYHDDITFNDDAMTHVVDLLQAVAKGEARFGFVDATRREKAAAALAAGIRCMLDLQVVIGGRKTVWCAQYDALSREVSSARKMEPATLSGLESARILEFLMSVPRPSPELVAAIESGLKWMDGAKITGLTKGKRDGVTVYDADPASTQVFWARFYDLATGKPVFPGRDGVLYSTFAEMAAKNRLGYDFYTTLPGSIVNNGQKKWRKMLAAKP